MFFPTIPVALLVVVVVFGIDTFCDGLICAKVGCCRSTTTYTKIISPIARDNANTMDLFTLIDVVECTAQINFNLFSFNFKSSVWIIAKKHETSTYNTIS